MNWMFAISFALLIYNSAIEAFPKSVPNGKRLPTIVGGVEAKPGEFPWIIGIRRPLTLTSDLDRHGCGATIINSRWVITAAHCTQGDLSTYELIAGDYDNEIAEPSEQRRNVSLIVNHPSYKVYSNDFDIALMRVSAPFEFNEFVQPIRLAPRGFIPPKFLTVAGWGRLYETGPFPSVLMKVDVPFVPDDVCRAAYSEDRIKDEMLCAGDVINGNVDACKGDSGGPLVALDGDSTVLCGIVSFGEGCATVIPGVYTEIQFYNDWIESVVLVS